MRKLPAKILLLVFILVNLLPLPVLAAGNTPRPQKPYEKVAVKKGDWYTNRISYDNKSQLIVGYRGSYETQAEKPVLEFSLPEKTLLTGIYIPYEGRVEEDVTLTVNASSGNVYQGFTAIADSTGGISEENNGEESQQEIHTLYIFTPENNLVLPQGAYTLNLNGSALPADAFLIKGYNYAAYQKYQEDLVEWAREKDEPGEAEEVYVSFGNKDILASYEQFIEGEDEKGEPSWQKAPNKYVAPAFTLDGEYTIDEIILSTWNDGQGAAPGLISILNEAGGEVASYRAQGASQGGAPNTLWAVMPGLLLPAGVYTIHMDMPEVLDYDEGGEPVFHVEASVPAAPQTNFTGTYRIWAELYKTNTLIGAIKADKASFELEDFELTVLDKGSFIELIGNFEGLPFSQNCEVTEREKGQLKAKFNFTADLTKLPYKAKIGAIAEVALTEGNAGRIDIAMAGQGFYSRAASKEKGADENVYSLTLRGNQVKKDLPPFVMTAIATAYGAGNIPGPDTPAQAVAGILFPPLVALVVSVLQELLKPKELVSKLSVGEQAMKDANRSLGKGLYTEEEARAWATMADALGASGGDEQDAFSVGDNERPGGADYVAPKESGFGGSDDYDSEGFEQEENGYEEYGQEEYGYIEPAAPEKVFGSEREQLEAERNEWLENLKSSKNSADPDDPRSAELHKEYENYINSLNERIDRLSAAQQAAKQGAARQTMTVQVDHTGRTAEIAYTPETDTWHNTETGNEFNMETYKRDVAPNFAQDKAFIEEQRRKLEAGDTAMDQA
ncbi:MAG: hypothetical protein RBT41_12555, partial [Clostridia bacterium]|nr:hypothetical protein [Clostridia bacterium]